MNCGLLITMKQHTAMTGDEMKMIKNYSSIQHGCISQSCLMK